MSQNKRDTEREQRRLRKDRLAKIDLALAYDEYTNEPVVIVDPESGTSLEFWPINNGAWGR